jgi:hypothetical protein
MTWNQPTVGHFFKTLPYEILAQIVMVIDNLILSEHVYRYKKLNAKSETNLLHCDFEQKKGRRRNLLRPLFIWL